MNKEEKLLEELDGIFMEVKDEEPSFENVPDGEYLAVVTGAKYKMSKSDKPMVQFLFKITEGEYKDKLHNKCMMMVGADEAKTRANQNRYGTELKKYGIVATSLTGSFEQIKKLKGTEVKLKIETSDSGFTNTHVEVI